MECGVSAFNGLSVILREITITSCSLHGVLIFTALGRLENVRIEKCRGSGLAVRAGGLVKLEKFINHENKFSTMRVNNNCLAGPRPSGGTFYGLDVGYSRGVIVLLKPLTKATVSCDNGVELGTSCVQTNVQKVVGGGCNWSNSENIRVDEDYVKIHTNYADC